MKPKLTIEFASQEDLVWAHRMITRAMEYTQANGPGCATPISGGPAAILLSALGRAKKITRKPLPMVNGTTQ